MYTNKISESDVLIWRPSGVINFKLVSKAIDEIEVFETNHPGGFNRFANFTDVDGICLTFQEMRILAQRRSDNYHGREVRTGFLASTDLLFGMARMYGIMLQTTLIDVNVFRTLEENAAWLGVESYRLVDY